MQTRQNALLRYTILALTMAATTVFATPCLDYEDAMGAIDRSRCPGDVLAVAALDHLVLAACDDGGLWVLDATDSGRPAPLAAMPLPGVALDVVAAGGFAYLACGEGGLQVVDVTLPHAPLLCGSLALAGVVRGLTFVGDRLYVYGADDDCDGDGSVLHVVNIDTPAAPSLVGSFAFGTDIEDLVVAGGLACAARTIGTLVQMGPDWFDCMSQDGYAVLDVSQADAPAPLAVVAGQEWEAAYCVEVVGGLMYLGLAHQEIEVYDLADPAAPALVTTVSFAHTPNPFVTSMELAGDRLYVGTYDGWLEILDVSTPAAPVLVDEINTQVYSLDLALVGRHVYVAGGPRGLVSVRVEDPAAPELPTADALALAQLPAGAPGAVQIAGEHAYICDTSFRVIDIADPAAPVVTGTIPTTYQSCQYLVLDGQRAYVSGDSSPQGDISVFDVADPYAPALLYQFSTGSDYANPIAVEDGILFGGAGGIVKVYDCTSDDHADFVRNLAPATMLHGVAVRDHLLYAFASVGVNQRRLLVIDVADLQNPVVVGQTPADWGAEITLDGDRAYLTSGVGVCIVDITDPAAPVQLNVTRGHGNCRGVMPAGDYLYWADYAGMRVLDVRDPQAPNWAGNLPVAINRLAVGSACWLAAGAQTTYFLPLECKTLVTAVSDPVPGSSRPWLHLVGATPNPFNPQTQVVFETDRGGHVRLRIHDLRGRVVAEPLSGFLTAGRHAIRWDGLDRAGRPTSSGTYFAVVESGASRAACRLTMVR